MKKLILFLSIFLTLVSCSENDQFDVEFESVNLPTDRIEAPEIFRLNQINTLRVYFTFPNQCYRKPSADVSPSEGNRKRVELYAVELLNTPCSQATRIESIEIPVFVDTNRDYTFVFWKGFDNNGEEIYEQIIIPVKNF